MDIYRHDFVERNIITIAWCIGLYTVYIDVYRFIFSLDLPWRRRWGSWRQCSVTADWEQRIVRRWGCLRYWQHDSRTCWPARSLLALQTTDKAIYTFCDIYTSTKTTSVGDARLSVLGVAGWPVILTGWPAGRWRWAWSASQEQTLSGTGARVYTAYRDGWVWWRVSVRPRLGAF